MSATEARIDGRRTILVGTNNYLGLTFDRDCMAAVAALDAGGHRDHRVADRQRHLWWPSGARGRAGALPQPPVGMMVFSTGYQANLGMLLGLAGPRDVILLDADSHSSIYDGAG